MTMQPYDPEHADQAELDRLNNEAFKRSRAFVEAHAVMRRFVDGDPTVTWHEVMAADVAAEEAATWFEQTLAGILGSRS